MDFFDDNAGARAQQNESHDPNEAAKQRRGKIFAAIISPIIGFFLGGIGAGILEAAGVMENIEFGSLWFFILVGTGTAIVYLSLSLYISRRLRR